MELKSVVSLYKSLNPRKLAPAITGIERLKEIFVESYLSNLRNLPAVITIPDLLTPGIRANIWKQPITKIDFKSKFEFNFLFGIIYFWCWKNLWQYNCK